MERVQRQVGFLLNGKTYFDLKQKHFRGPGEAVCYPLKNFCLFQAPQDGVSSTMQLHVILLLLFTFVPLQASSGLRCVLLLRFSILKAESLFKVPFPQVHYSFNVVMSCSSIL
jgi:hypothetical protein